DEDVGAYTLGGAMMDRPQRQILDAFETAKGALDGRQALVRQDRRCLGQFLPRDVGPDDINAVECRLVGDLGVVTGERETALINVELEVLGDIEPLKHFADAEPDLGSDA